MTDISASIEVSKSIRLCVRMTLYCSADNRIRPTGLRVGEVADITPRMIAEVYGQRQVAVVDMVFAKLKTWVAASKVAAWLACKSWKVGGFNHGYRNRV